MLTTDAHASPVPPTPIHAGDVVDGRYRILQQIADGGMGTVFLAEHVLIKRKFAVKFLHRELASDTAMVKRFLNEAMAAGTLGHPHIVEATDMGFAAAGVPYIVFEYLDGTMLTEEIYRVGGLPVRRALRIGKQIASALECAHNAGIVHLDLKSDNVYLTDKEGTQDHVKVLDFGISRFLNADLDPTQRGMVAGTPEYMAPEQVTRPDGVDKRADVYALGVLLYEMLTARRPFLDEDPNRLLQRVVHEAPRPLGRPGVPAELERTILERMMAKDADARFASMRDAEEAIDAIVQRSGLGALGSSPKIVILPVATLPPPVRSAPAGTAPPPLPALSVSLTGPRVPTTPTPVEAAPTQPAIDAVSGRVLVADAPDPFGSTTPSSIPALVRPADDAGSVRARRITDEVAVRRRITDEIARRAPNGGPAVSLPSESAPLGDRARSATGEPPVGDRARSTTGEPPLSPLGRPPTGEVRVRVQMPAAEVPAPVATEPTARVATAARAAAPRRRGWGWLAAAVLAGVAGGLLVTTVPTAPTPPADPHVAAEAGLAAEAAELARRIEGQAALARARAESMARAPVLRAAIDTDAATLRDLAHTESLFAVGEGEAIEVFLGATDAISALRLPESAPPLADATSATQLLQRGDLLAIAVTTPITTPRGSVGGTLAVALPIAISDLGARVAPHATSATLAGLARPISVFGGTPTPDAPRRSIPVPLAAGLTTSPLTLEAILTPPPPPAASPLSLAPRVGHVLLALAGLLLLVFLWRATRRVTPELHLA